MIEEVHLLYRTEFGFGGTVRYLVEVFANLDNASEARMRLIFEEDYKPSHVIIETTKVMYS